MQQSEAALKIEDTYLVIQRCESGWDYTLLDSEFHEMDGGQLDMPELSIEEISMAICKEYLLDISKKQETDFETIFNMI